MRSNIVIKKALEIILLVELFSPRVVSHHESFPCILTDTAITSLVDAVWDSGHVEMKNGRLKQLNITHHHICGYFCLLSIFARSTAAFFWPEGVENLPYQTQQLLSKHNQLGWRMACSSASIPRGPGTYNTKNNMNKEKQRTSSQSKVEYFSSWEFCCFPFPLVDCSWSYLTLVLFEDICSVGWLWAVPCGKMEESWGGRAAVADRFLLSPGALGTVIMKCTVDRCTVMLYALTHMSYMYQHFQCVM